MNLRGSVTGPIEKTQRRARVELKKSIRLISNYSERFRKRSNNIHIYFILVV